MKAILACAAFLLPASTPDPFGDAVDVIESRIYTAEMMRDMTRGWPVVEMYYQGRADALREATAILQQYRRQQTN